jgi:hypothetical protein
MNILKIMQTKNRISKLTGKDPVGNMHIINKLKRQLRRLENA